MAAAWRPPEGLVLDGREHGGRLCHAGEKAIITAIDTSCFHFPCSLQRSGSGSGKSIKNRALGLIRQRDPAHLQRWTSSHSNARLEGLNGLFQAARARARGYRNITTFTTIIYLIAAPLGNLFESI